MGRWGTGLCLALLMGVQAAQGATVTVLKEGSALTAGGALDSAFSGATAANILALPVHDTYLIGNPAAAWNCYGQQTSSSGALLLKFNVLGIPGIGPGSKIYRAQLRLRATSGNTAGGVSHIITHDWDEAVCTLAGPDGPMSPNKTWGPSSNALFGTADYYGGATTPFDSTASNWLVKDVTADVQGFVDNTFANYGWYAYSSNYVIEMSENTDDGGRPALFISWDPNAAPNAVTDLAVTRVDWYKLTLQWTAPSDMPPGPVDHYDLRMSTSPITDDATFDASAPVTSVPAPVAPGSVQTLTISSGLLPNTTYYFAMKVYDRTGLVSPLNTNGPVTATTLVVDPVAPSQITDLSTPADLVRSNSLTLNWTAVADDGSDAASGLAAGYDLRYSTSPITDDATFAAATAVVGLGTPKAAGSAESFTLHGLTPSTTYYFAIKACDEVPNWSAFSNVVMVATKEVDPFPPARIMDLRVSGTLSRVVSLNWSAPADVGSAGMASYDLRYSTSEISSDADFAAATAVTGLPLPAAPGTTQGVSIPMLNPSTTYYFAIKSSDYAEPANTSPMSNIASGTTRPPIQPIAVHNPWLVNDRVADCHNLASMAATYVNAYTPDGVIPPANNEDKAINIYNNQKRRLYHWADEPPAVGGNDINDPTYNQNVFGWGLCGRHATQASTIVTAVPGLISHKMGISSPWGHWMYQVEYDGGLHAFDTMCTMYVYTKGTPAHLASCAEMKADSSILLNSVADGRCCPGLLLCGDDINQYQQAMGNASDNGAGGVATTKWTGNMDLRLGQVFNRSWQSMMTEHPTPHTGTPPNPPYHHEANLSNEPGTGRNRGDDADTTNYNYWEPYTLDSAGNALVGITYSKTYRRWANGTDVVAPDFRNGGYSALLDSSSSGIKAFNDDGVTPDLHAAAVGTTGNAVFKVNVPFYITDANISGDFTRVHSGDTCKVWFSTSGTTWTQVYDVPVGTTHVDNLNLRSSVFGLWTTYYIKVEIKSTTALSDAGVTNFALTTVFEHNKGAMAYLDKGVNNITLTFDNAAELAASGNCIHVTYHWKEYDGANWTIDKQFDTFVTTSPATFTITTGGSKVPRTEYIAMEVTQPDIIAPSPIDTLAAGTATKNSVQLTWTATGDDGSQGQASRYDLRYSTSPISDMDSFNTATEATGLPMPQAAGTPESFTVTGLAPTTTYYFAIVAYDKGANCSGLVAGSITTATTLVDVPPAPVTDLRATSPNKNAIQLVWTATGEDGTVGTASRYDLRYSTSPIDSGNFTAATPVAGLPAPKPVGQAEAFTVSGLTPATTYYLALVAYDAANQPSGLSNVIWINTPGDMPPAAVPDLSAPLSGIARDSIQLTWTATGEDGVVGTAARYDLRYSTSPISDMTSFDAATVVTGVPAPKLVGQAESLTVTGLTVSTTYYFALVVYDAADQPSGLSNVLMTHTRKLGDVDGDDQVNLADLKLMVAAWNSEGGGAYANWNPDADLDGDNYVNLADLKILVAHWNQ